MRNKFRNRIQRNMCSSTIKDCAENHTAKAELDFFLIVEKIQERTYFSTLPFQHINLVGRRIAPKSWNVPRTVIED